MKKRNIKFKSKTKIIPLKHSQTSYNAIQKGDVDDYIYSCSWHNVKRVSER